MSLNLRHFYASSSVPARGRSGKKCGILRICNGVVAQWLALALVALLPFPTLAAASLQLSQASSDHEIRCSVVAGEISVTLVHPAADTRFGHQHNALERVLFSSSSDDSDHPDHRFSFSTASAIELKRVVTVDELVQLPIAHFPVSDFKSLTAPHVWSGLSRPEVSGHPPDVPSRRRAGTVIRC